MNGYVANTDADWHAHLLATGPHDEVNVWQPAGGRTFRAIVAGEAVSDPGLLRWHNEHRYDG